LTLEQVETVVYSEPIESITFKPVAGSNAVIPTSEITAHACAKKGRVNLLMDYIW